MTRKDVLVIRIGLSIESVDKTTVTVEPESIQTESTTPPAETVLSKQNEPGTQRPRRSYGRGDSPRDSELGEKRAMTDMQRKALFRIAYELGDRESALSRILEALGVERLEWATRAQASKAIELLGANRKNGSPRRSNGAGHD
jgi:hypothetical protein